MKTKKIIALILVIAFSLILLAPSANAFSLSEQVKNFGSKLYGGDTVRAPQEIAASFIQAGLGFLGLLFFMLILYGGYMYMTAMGKDEQVKKAKNVLIYASIGLIIVLSAFAIASFVLSNIIRAT